MHAGKVLVVESSTVAISYAEEGPHPAGRTPPARSSHPLLMALISSF